MLHAVFVVEQDRLLLAPVGRGEDAVVVGVEVRLQAGFVETGTGVVIEYLRRCHRDHILGGDASGEPLTYGADSLIARVAQLGSAPAGLNVLFGLLFVEGCQLVQGIVGKEEHLVVIRVIRVICPEGKIGLIGVIAIEWHIFLIVDDGETLQFVGSGLIPPDGLV